MRLSGKTALVTGAGAGIGRAIAERFSSEGCNIVGFSNDEGNLADLAGRISEAGGACKVVTGSVTRRADIITAVQTAMGAFGQIDILVNNAGIASSKPLLEITDDDWDVVFNTNLKGMFVCAQECAREMIPRGGGRIINMASINSYRVSKDDLHVLYQTSKGGVVQLTHALSSALGQHDITVNAIAPGWILTDMTRRNAEGREDEILKRLVARRIGLPEDVAELAVILATEQTRFLTGQVIVLDGGQTLLL